MIYLWQFITNTLSHVMRRSTKCKRQRLKNIAGESFLYHHTVLIQPTTVTICSWFVQVIQNKVDLILPKMSILWNAMTLKQKNTLQYLFKYIYNFEFYGKKVYNDFLAKRKITPASESSSKNQCAGKEREYPRFIKIFFWQHPSIPLSFRSAVLKKEKEVYVWRHSHYISRFKKHNFSFRITASCTSYYK